MKYLKLLQCVQWALFTVHITQYICVLTHLLPAYCLHCSLFTRVQLWIRWMVSTATEWFPFPNFHQQLSQNNQIPWNHSRTEHHECKHTPLPSKQKVDQLDTQMHTHTTPPKICMFQNRGSCGAGTRDPVLLFSEILSFEVMQKFESPFRSSAHPEMCWFWNMLRDQTLWNE